MYALGRGAVSSYAHLRLKMDVVFSQQLPGGAKIITPNHPTTFDPFLMIAMLPEQVHILVTQSAYDVPVFGAYLRAAGHIPVITEHGSRAFGMAQRLLDQGKTIAIFPEGALSPLDGRCAKPHTGAARLALITGAALIPVGIAVQQEHIRFHELHIKGQREIARWYPRGWYASTFGLPMIFEGDVQDRAHVGLLSERLMRQIERLRTISTYRLNRALSPAVSVTSTSEFPTIS